MSLASVLTVSQGPVAAQARPAPGEVRGAFGSVDLQKVFNDYKVKQASSEEIQSLGRGLDSVLGRLRDANAAFLPDSEVRELAKLYEKPAPTDADKKRISELERKALSLVDELSRLQNVAMPNDQQTARLSELTAARQKGSEVFEGVRQEYQQRLSSRQGELSEKITAEMRAAIAKVAQEKNLAVVFDAAVAVYAANDITGDVIKQLNK